MCFQVRAVVRFTINRTVDAAYRWTRAECQNDEAEFLAAFNGLINAILEEDELEVVDLLFNPLIYDRWQEIFQIRDGHPFT